MMIVVLLLSMGLVACTGAAPAPAPAPKPAAAPEIVLKMVTAFPPQNNSVVNLNALYIPLLNARGKGRLRVDVAGGPEAIATMDQFAAVKAGTVDMMLSTSAYWSGDIPELGAESLATPESYLKMLKDQRYTDFVNNKILIPRANMRAIGTSWSGEMFRIFTTKQPLRTLDDIKGLKIRGAGGYFKFLIEGLGATQVRIAPGDVLSALQRGIIDGAVRGPQQVISYGEAELYKYAMDLPLNSGRVDIFINENSWQKIPSDLQQMMLDVNDNMTDVIFELTFGQGEWFYQRWQREFDGTVIKPGPDVVQRLSELRKAILPDLLEKHVAPELKAELEEVFKPYFY
jgi:TRAP-type C4-dicarboxylate transport system substrate-binding protein